MSTPMERARENVTGLLVFLILGAGFVAMFAGLNWFWLVWVLGFAVLLPIVGILTGEADEHEDWSPAPGRAGRRSRDRIPAHDREADRDDDRDALETLRDRYARGELSDEQFERKLEALLETETFEAARDRLTRRERERVDTDADVDVDVDRDREREREFDYD